MIEFDCSRELDMLQDHFYDGRMSCGYSGRGSGQGFFSKVRRFSWHDTGYHDGYGNSD